MRPGLGCKQTMISTRGIRNVLVLFLLACSFFWLFPLPAAAKNSLTPGPIILTWTADPATSQTITWLAPDPSPARLQYLKADNYNGTFDSASEIEVRGTRFDSTNYRYTAVISGLTPDTGYICRVGNEGTWSEILHFSTAGSIDSFSFMYMGDIQSGYAEWGSSLSSVYQACPQIKFSLLGGDITDNGNDENEWGEFLDAATGVFSRIPVMPAMGNHDGLMYANFFALPGNGPEGLKQEFYSFDYGNAHFVVLNSNNNTSEKVKQWLQEDLQNTSKLWKFAMFHHPPYPAFDDYKAIDESICKNWVPILEENGVDMVFVGHQHEYMRTCPIYQGNMLTDPAAYGIVYVMGNAGSKIYGGGAAFPYIAREESGSSCQLIKIEGNTLTMTAKKAGGELIENYTINKEVKTSPVYRTVPAVDSAYTTGTNDDGISTMTVNAGVSGLKYFPVNIESICAHPGLETVVFSHSRNGCQLELNATRVDLESTGTVQAGFNIQAGDVIKVFVVDNLTNATDHNPIVMQ